jgi:hypothetical protein
LISVPAGAVSGTRRYGSAISSPTPAKISAPSRSVTSSRQPSTGRGDRRRNQRTSTATATIKISAAST